MSRVFQQAGCQSRGGRLAEITSAEENAFVTRLLNPHHRRKYNTTPEQYRHQAATYPPPSPHSHHLATCISLPQVLLLFLVRRCLLYLLFYFLLYPRLFSFFFSYFLLFLPLLLRLRLLLLRPLLLFLVLHSFSSPARTLRLLVVVKFVRMSC